MTYFKNFPLIKYKFGNNEESVFYKDASIYVDLIDQIADNVSFYSNFTIVDGERPDTLSYKLYGTSDYYWTFFLLNEGLRESGWPLSVNKSYEFIEEAYSNYSVQLDGSYKVDGVITPMTLATLFPVGQSFNVDGSAVATVVKKNLDIGQVVFKYESGDESQLLNFTQLDYTNSDGETLVFNAGALTNFYNNVVEYNSPAYYTDSLGARTDIDPYDIATSIAPLIPVTYQEKFLDFNDGLRVIKIFKQDAISNIVNEFNRLVKG
jgi:hypothetical protein